MTNNSQIPSRTFQTLLEVVKVDDIKANFHQNTRQNSRWNFSRERSCD